jgi:hypothetical protein
MTDKDASWPGEPTPPPSLFAQILAFVGAAAAVTLVLELFVWPWLGM